MKDRLQAFLIHLTLSVLVLSITLALVALVWYPAPLFWADGGREVIVLIALVDVIAGPTLTFVVYRKGKKSLKFDLGVIAALQLAALSYGAMVMYQQRPVFVAFALDMFYTVTAKQVETKSPKKLNELAALMPKASNWVYVAYPQDKAALQQWLSRQGRDHLALSLHTDLYQPLDETNLRKAMSKEVNIREILKGGGREGQDREQAALENFLAEHRVTDRDVAFLPLVARYRQMFVAYRKSDATMIGFLEIQPELVVGKVE